MNLSDSAHFSRENFSRLAALLGTLLEIQPLGAVTAAADLLRISVYPPSVDLPFTIHNPSTAPFSTVFASVAEWMGAVRDGRPAAVEAALEVLSGLDAEATADMVRAALDVGLWPEAKERAWLVLSRSASKESFVRLLDAVAERPRAGYLLTQSPYPDGCPLVLERLQGPALWEYEPVTIPTVAEWNALSPQEQELTQARLDAASTAHNANDTLVYGVVGYLGQKSYAKAAPLITRLYTEHPSKNVRLAAGHALTNLADPASLETLIALGDSYHERRRWFAVKARIIQDPPNAVQNLGGAALLLPTTNDIVRSAFEILRMNATNHAKAGTPEHAWVRQDPHWLEVAAHWVKDRHAGGTAENLFEYFPKQDVTHALAATRTKARTTRTRSSVRARKSALKDESRAALAAFHAGDGPEAWRMLAGLDAAVRDLQHLTQAQEIARLTMLQARADLERIVERLDATGYRFASPGHVLVPPAADVSDQLEELESIVGVLPLSLRAALEHLGSVNLAGDHPDWPKSAHVQLRPVDSDSDLWLTDPLVLAPASVLLDDTEGWAGHRPFELAFSGDALTKAGYSGGLYTVLVPCEAADVPIAGEPGSRTFIEHFRLALKHGGFAGFETITDRPQPFLNSFTASHNPE